MSLSGFQVALASDHGEINRNMSLVKQVFISLQCQSLLLGLVSHSNDFRLCIKNAS